MAQGLQDLMMPVFNCRGIVLIKIYETDDVRHCSLEHTVVVSLEACLSSTISSGSRPASFYVILTVTPADQSSIGRKPTSETVNG